jgi:hypothetical protein
MVLLDFITANPDVVVAAATVIGGWLGLTKKKANTNALKEKVLAKLRRELLTLIEKYATVDEARKHLNWAADALLDELKVKRSAAIDLVLEPLIEQALKEYVSALGPFVMKLQMAELFGAVSKLPDAFKADAAKLEAAETAFRGSSNVEVVE